MISRLLDLNLKDYDAIILDCYGTVINISNKKNPYKILYNHINSIKKIDNFYQDVLIKNMNIFEIQQYYNIELNKNIVNNFLHLIDEELNSIYLFDDTIEFLENNKNKNIIICSNIAQHYVSKTRSMLPNHNFIMSCEVGFKKPDNNIYSICHNKLMNDKKRTIFIGDNYQNDYIKPIEFGFEAVLIKRV